MKYWQILGLQRDLNLQINTKSFRYKWHVPKRGSQRIVHFIYFLRKSMAFMAIK